jgi:3-hydroxymyristoyl/3-hydroxydecanoyl-(acyl carrier protein) dehydratase
VTLEPQVLGTVLEPNQVRLELALAPDLVFFEGHFPSCAILPGVVQIGWAIDYARRHLGLQGQCVGMKAVKFSRAIQPHMPVTLTATLRAEGAQLHFVYQSQATECSSGIALFA